MKHCAQCKLDFPDPFRFCGSCGGALTNSMRCASCGELSDGKWAFCTSCGAKLSSQTAEISSDLKTPAPSAPIRDTAPPTLTLPVSEEPKATSRPRAASLTHEWYSAADLYDEETTATRPVKPPPPEVQQTTHSIPELTTAAQTDDATKSAPALTMLSAYGETEAPPQFRWWHGAILGLFGLLVVGGLAVGSWYWWSHRGAVAQTASPTTSSPGAVSENPDAPPASSPTSSLAPTRPLTTSSADDEIKQLRERRSAAKPADGAAILSALEQAEKRYPSDYRFPYERAKLSIVGVASHDEAFGALALAAEKAIDDGKAQQMLDNLTADGDGDFRKLARGHREWGVIMQALRSKDKAALNPYLH